MQVLLIEKYKSKYFEVYFLIDIYKPTRFRKRFTIYNCKYKCKFAFLVFL